jgi:hypothetical protein
MMQLRQRQKRINEDRRGHRLVLRAEVFDRAGNPLPTSCDAKIDWKALSVRLGHADVAFTMKQYVQTDLVADRQVAQALAELIVGGSLASIPMEDQTGEEGRGDAA